MILWLITIVLLVLRASDKLQVPWFVVFLPAAIDVVVGFMLAAG